jgi:DNA phosphorothioation-dependent restriction protein DptH
MRTLRPLRAQPPQKDIHVLVGFDTTSGQDSFWSPSPNSGTPNPHLLIVGESGAGKTYLAQCVSAELVQQGAPVVIFDFGQGFSARSSSKEFAHYARPIEINAAAEGISINPLTIFPTDVHGPANVSQRIADTFARVYPTIGVQQHAVLRDAIFELFIDAGIDIRRKTTWTRPPPEFASLPGKLEQWSMDKDNPMRRIAASVASHISTVFVFNTFRSSGLKLDWNDVFAEGGRVYIVQLKGLEHQLERVVTELLLWNLIGYIEGLGPGSLRAFVLLDEAHRLAFSAASPTEKLLREARKFGVGLILASQQPEDFSPVAFSNTATKVILNVSDERGTILRQIVRKQPKTGDLPSLLRQIRSLPRGVACLLTSSGSQIVRISDFKRRKGLWDARSNR